MSGVAAVHLPVTPEDIKADFDQAGVRWSRRKELHPRRGSVPGFMMSRLRETFFSRNLSHRAVVTIRYKSKLHHVGMGRALAGTRIILLVAGRNIRIITTKGQLLRNFELDPSRNYQPQSLG